MHHQYLHKLDAEITCFLQSFSQSKHNVEYSDLRQLAENNQKYVQYVLEEEKKYQEEILMESCEETEGKIIGQAYSVNEVGGISSPIDLSNKKSIEEKTTKQKQLCNKNTCKSENKGNFKLQLLMENLNKIIEYQNQNIFANKLCNQQNQISNKNNQEEYSFQIQQINKQNSSLVHNFIKNCKSISEDLQYFQAFTLTSYSNSSHNKDSQSLLTQLLENSKICENSEKQNFKEMSKAFSVKSQNIRLKSKLKPMKQINFEAYKLQNLRNGNKKQKKVKKDTINSCSKCLLF